MTAVAQFSRGCSGGSSGSYFILIALFLFLVDLRFNFQLQFSSFETSLYIFQDKTIANTDSSHKITESIEQCTELTSKCNAQRKVFDLADIVMERKLVFSLLLSRKSMRITKIMFQRPMKCCYKKILKGWQKESFLSVILSPELACLQQHSVEFAYFLMKTKLTFLREISLKILSRIQVNQKNF